MGEGDTDVEKMSGDEFENDYQINNHCMEYVRGDSLKAGRGD